MLPLPRAGTHTISGVKITEPETLGRATVRPSLIVQGIAITLSATAANADDLKIALIYGKTGPLEAYAKQTETGLRMGLEYATKGTMTLDGRKIVVITKDDQSKPDLSKAALAEAYQDDKADIAIGTTASPAALAMLPVAEENKKILIVEPAVADQISRDKWNRYIFRTARARDASGRRGEQEDPHRRAGGCRPDHRRQVEPLYLPYRAQLLAGRDLE